MGRGDFLLPAGAGLFGVWDVGCEPSVGWKWPAFRVFDCKIPRYPDVQRRVRVSVAHGPVRETSRAFGVYALDRTIHGPDLHPPGNEPSGPRKPNPLEAEGTSLGCLVFIHNQRQDRLCVVLAPNLSSPSRVASDGAVHPCARMAN